MSTLQATNLKNAASASNNITLDTSGNATVAGTMAMGSSFLRNRIINGDMRIDQRNAGASVSIGTGAPFVVDRWNCYCDMLNMTGQRTQATVPVGFNYALGVTVGTGASPTSGQISRIAQSIEGFNIGDLHWGTASAQAITLSFWVRTSVTGTHSGAVTNSASSRTYPFSLTVSSANTWEYKTVTIPGDTSGTWLTDNGIGITVRFNLGTGTTYLGTANTWAGSNYFGTTGSVQLSSTTGATFYITGVQLEAGSTATPFERRLYGQELALCRRYCPALITTVNSASQGQAGQCYSTTNCVLAVPFDVPARVAPTGITVTNPTSFSATNSTAGRVAATAIAFTGASPYGALIDLTSGANFTAGNATTLWTGAGSLPQIIFNGCEL